ncbi:hypothetical protein BOTBODRAFT_143380 [Botryobasidium botryosum FD-172 SS1]|uniref:HNH nuclease domain-containing protein n=1 Tax=Botryobasidium botryosum (strain FD-172 SS1) TaxID=930990 RepID=A0A067N2J5_BOTB1|nr:hypothetical protein BOTBODRAFT_143380 [Botryobasidium botryosum FD-172 SS1]
MANVQLHLNVGGAWLTALEIPFDDFAIFSRNPRGWLDYVAHALVGVDGILSLSDVDNAVVPCGLDLFVTPGESYYFHTIGDAVFVDPDVVTLASTHSSQLRDTDLPSNLQARDGDYCIFTNITHPDISYIIPHAKGDDYIRSLTTKRCNSEGEQVIIEEIDDVRNVLALNACIHKEMKIGNIAFLKTPIRSLKSDDVSNAPGTDPDGYRLTLHIFSRHAETRTFLVHGAGARLPQPLADNWPPEVLLTALYAGAALSFWGTNKLRSALRNATRDSYYPDGIRKRGADSDGEKEKEKKKRATEKQSKERTERYERRAEKSSGLDLALALSSLYAERQTRHAAVAKVEGWLKSN